MIDALQKLAYGVSLSLEPANLLYAFIGSVLGTLVGVLPGLGPVTTIAVLLPVTYHAGSPLGAIIMLASIYYGAMYGGSTTSILLKVPGEAASVVTCIDGYEMAKKGRAGPALAIAAIGSFIAGTLAVCALALVGPAFASFAVSFGPPEYFALALFGLSLSATLSAGSPIRGMCMVFAGLLLGLIGVDTITGVERYTFGIMSISDGIDLVPMLMGLFGLGEILHNLDSKDESSLVASKVGRLFPSRDDWNESSGPILRGSFIGFLVGLIPGGGAILASLMSYTLEKKLSKTPEKFGHGAIAGVAGPESANNSAATASFVPLLTLGLPGNAVTAVLFAGLLIQNVQPGPLMLVKSPDVFWGVIASMYVGNIMLLILNLPLVGLWVQLLRVPSWVLSPAILLIAIFGTYSLRSNFADVQTLMIFGAIGYVFRKADLDAGPLIMAFILANILDTSLRQSLLMGDGSIAIVFLRPISAVILLVAAIVVLTQAFKYFRGEQRLGEPESAT
ncbi:tripartite tricarboxylate transporter permease [Bradyrhizobium sp. NP1]|jgi:putative tricarboxylic transport membrane protein|uniref:tripartite tricarboxylate transporter permease n=1 Tax=Bradyrhizobium sp. NP1 TaxID=3049772 RepID=UPI0025A587BB|nr:tripartite tricarboxylate transporter permease [Bradyrhizobium sp. NP1]WJR80879.1 tripartite tricarboxylate transporter permease [Bradyrhizobium sp. NP1]